MMEEMYLHSEASKPEPRANFSSGDIAARLSQLAPEKLRLVARELKKRRETACSAEPRSTVAASPLVPIRASGSRTPLFLVHPVGGSVMAYHDLARYLAIEQPVYALQNLDSGKQDLLVEDMAFRYIDAIRTVCPVGPYFLGGHSMGGVVAFEMAIQLTAQGQQVSMVVMLDSPVRIIPHMQGQNGHSSLAVELMMLASIIASGQQAEFQGSLAELDALHPEEQINSVFQQLKRQQLVPANLDLTALRAAFTTFLGNLNALEKYKPGNYDGRVVILRAQDTSLDMKGWAEELCDDAAFGWQSHCKQPIAVSFVPGDHMLMNVEPNVRFTGAELQRFLNETRDQAKGHQMESAP